MGGWSPCAGDGFPYKRDPREVGGPFDHVSKQNIYEEQVLSRQQIHRSQACGLSSLRTREIHVVLLAGHSASGAVSQQHEGTQTRITLSH